MSLLPVSFIEKSDIPALKAMWTQAFGDPEELMDGFFSLLDGAGFGLVCRDGGRAVSMAYVLEGLSCGDRRCAYIYAVATLEEYRGRGLGAELMSACREKAMLRGSEVICTCPAEPSLYDWYAKVLDMAPVAYADERLYDKLSSTDLSVASLSAGEYGDSPGAAFCRQAPRFVSGGVPRHGGNALQGMRRRPVPRWRRRRRLLS
jgi:GNAT superfamily N-acetyltransferase